MEAPGQIIAVIANGENKTRNIVVFTGFVGVMSLIWLLYFPFLFFYRRTFADEESIEVLIKENTRKHHRKLFVLEEVYLKYKKRFEEEKKKCNLAPVRFRKSDEKRINRIRVRYDIPTELAKLIVAAKRGVISKILTKERITNELRRDFTKIQFENPSEKKD